MKNNRIFFTGGNGFLGKELIPLLISDGYHVTYPSSKHLDLTDTEQVKEYFSKNNFDYDIIIHASILGGRRWKTDDLDVYYKNMKMFENIFMYSDRVKKFIHFDSGSSLFRTGSISNTPYGFSKYCMSRSVDNIYNGVNLKIFGCFGVHEESTRFLSTCIRKYINKESIPIIKDRLMDFIYVKDLYKILKYVIKNDIKFVDCVYDKKHNLTDIAEMINQLGNYRVPVIIHDVSRDSDYCGKNFLDLDYIGIEQGIKDLYESFC